MSMVSTEPPALPGHPDELGSPWASGQMWKGGRLGKVHVGWEVGAILKKNNRAIEMCQSEDRAGSDFPKLKGRGGCLKSPKRIMVGGRG